MLPIVDYSLLKAFLPPHPLQISTLILLPNTIPCRKKKVSQFSFKIGKFSETAMVIREKVD